VLVAIYFQSERTARPKAAAQDAPRKIKAAHLAVGLKKPAAM